MQEFLRQKTSRVRKESRKGKEALFLASEAVAAAVAAASPSDQHSRAFVLWHTLLYYRI